MNPENQGTNVRWQGAADLQAEYAARERESPVWPLPHMTWPKPTVTDAADTRLVAEVGGQLVGRVILDTVYPPFGEIVNMHVIPAFRGQGAGSQLIDSCILSLNRMNFMAAFLQTEAHLTPALRLYKRKGFQLAATGEMLRLVRFLNHPLLDWFQHGHPLAMYAASADQGTGQSRLTWADSVTGDKLELRLTGGSSDRDSDNYGPGLNVVALSTDRLGFHGSLSGPKEASLGTQLELILEMRNANKEPLPFVARLLLPAGCSPCGEWEGLGPAVTVEPDDEVQAAFTITLDADLDLAPLSYSASLSLPLTIEIFVDSTSFWLTHTIMVEGVRDLVPATGKATRSVPLAGEATRVRHDAP